MNEKWIVPFYRRGEAIELTATDYANRAGLHIDGARYRLYHLQRLGRVTSNKAQCGDVAPTVYALAPDAQARKDTRAELIDRVARIFIDKPEQLAHLPTQTQADVLARMSGIKGEDAAEGQRHV